ncbi:thiolase family protein [Amycolatopsis ultiminotia]|uniref:Thiolase family protein n=1 Tax=Amycolatopsis ultiminotia TaxID=543629 RepID=A0ABP6XJ18_9PSEU
MPEAVIAEAVRAPIGKRRGALSGVHAVDLSAHVLNEVVGRAGVDPAEVDDVVWGCVGQIGDQSSNIARFAALAAGWPDTIPGVTVNRACGSSQQAVDFAAQAVLSGRQQLVIAGGVEMMSAVPLGAVRAVGLPYGPAVLERYDDFGFNQGISAEAIAARWALTRHDLDEFAAMSHERAAAAEDGGAFTAQLTTVATPTGAMTRDEGIRRGTSVETLAALKPSFIADGVVHAGNSSQISDGAAALVVTTPEICRRLRITPIARYRDGVAVGGDPVEMLTAPIPATELVLKRAGLGIDDIGVFEVNEAFAPVPLAWSRTLGVELTRVNPLGGAIALGHPLGASGAILMTRMLHHMCDQGIRFGLQTMCEGGGTANATILELLG